MKAQIYIKTYLTCPHCLGDTGSSIDHLLKNKLPYQFGNWPCDSCGNYFKGVINSPDDIDIEIVECKRVNKLEVLLVLPPQDKPLYIVVEGMDFTKAGAAIDLDKSYFYESHSCPTNWLKAQRIYFDGDADPHGLFEFVRAIPSEEAQRIDSEIHIKNGYEHEGSSDSATDREVIEAIFPEIKDGFIPSDKEEFDVDKWIQEEFGPNYSLKNKTRIRLISYSF